jgi:hypothetical protein
METWQQISIRNKYLVSRDWVKCKVSWPWRHCRTPDLPCIMTQMSKTMLLSVAWECPACRSLAGTSLMPKVLR